MFLFSVLVPVFTLIGVGYLIVKRGFISAGAVRDFNNVVYYIGLPALLFYRISKSEINIVMAAKPVMLCIVSIVLCIFIGILYLYFQKKQSGDAGSVLQVIARANTVFIGLPVVYYFFESINYQDMVYVNNLTVLSLAILVPINNVVGVTVLVLGNKSDQKFVKIIVKNIFTNPIMLACVAGFIYSKMFDGFTVPVARTLEAMSGMTLPLSLIAVGGVLAGMKLSDGFENMFFIAFIKLILMPFIVLFMGKMLGFKSEYIAIAMILMACPSASTCVTLAQQLGGNVKLTSNVIFGTSVLSLFSLIIVLTISRGLFL